EPEHEPRLVGSISTLPASEAPHSGWRTSMTREVAGSTPPQKLSASVEATTGPSATPGRMRRAASVKVASPCAEADEVPAAGMAREAHERQRRGVDAPESA